MTTEDHHVLAFLGWLLLACIICWVIVIVGVWLVIQLLLLMDSFIVPVPVY